MLKWKIGDVTVTRVVEMEIPVPHSTERPFLPDATPEALERIPWVAPHFVTPEGHLVLAIHALLVEAPGMRMVVDTCVGNDKARAFLRGGMLSTPFLAQIAEAGFPREAVDAVVCTHLHVDHVGWNTMKDGDRWVPTFPNARYLIGKEEWRHWNAIEDAEQQAILADSVKPIFDAGLADAVAMDHRISPELRLMPTPGHTPGHVSVVIESKGETAIITGDLIHHPCQMAHPEWSPPFDSDREAARATRKAFLADVADRDVLVIGTHFAAPTAGHVRKDGTAYRFEA